MPPNKRPSPYGPVKFTSIDEYHASFPREVRQRLDEMRKIITSVIPKAAEIISYNMPAFRQNRNLVYYAAHKEHLGLYPTSTPLKAFEKELANYKTSKGAIQFPYSEKLPTGLIKKIIKYRKDEDFTLTKD